MVLIENVINNDKLSIRVTSCAFNKQGRLIVKL